MDENELRSALRTTMSNSPEPPPMQSEGVLMTARRAARRRNHFAAAGGAAALVAVTAVVIPAQNLLGTSGGGAYQAAGPAAAPSPDGASEPFEPSAIPTPSEIPLPSGVTEVKPTNTKDTWPAEASGDATFDSGSRYQKGRALLEDLLEVVPDGYTTPEGTTSDGIPHRDHQATVEGDGFGYLASTSVARNGGTGRLLVEVHEAGNELPSDPCALARTFWGMGGQCVVQKVGGKDVGVANQTEDQSIDQWAAYRHGDGTVVFVAQEKRGATEDPLVPALTELPLGVPDLARLATDKRFHLR